MAEYIEREKLKKRIDEEIEAFGNPNESDNPVAYGGLLSMKYCRSAVVTAPTADVVEVVRCRECKHSYFVKSCSKYECRKGNGGLKFSNNFCSDGERKEQK